MHTDCLPHLLDTKNQSAKKLEIFLPQDHTIDKLLEDIMKVNAQIIDFDRRIKDYAERIEKIEKQKAEISEDQLELKVLNDEMKKLVDDREKLKTSFAESMVRLEQVEADVKSVKRKSEDVQTEVHLLVVKNARDNIDRERAVDKKLSDLQQKNSFQELEMNKLIEAKKQNEKKIEALETAASSHENEIDKLRRSMIKNSQVNLNTQLKDSLRELTEKVDRELNSLSEDIRVLYQEIQTLKSHVLYKTTSHTVKMTDFTKYSQTPDSQTRRQNFPVIPTLHEETPLKLETPSSQGVFELPRLSNLPSTFTSVSTTITPRQRPQSVKVRTFETRPEIMSHQTSAQDRKNRLTRRNSCPSMTSSHKNK